MGTITVLVFCLLEMFVDAKTNLTEARAAAEDAVSKVESFQAEVVTSANYTLVSSEMVAKASNDAMAPYQEQQAQIMSRMKEIGNATNISHRDLKRQRSKLRRALDGLERHEHRALDKRMRHLEESARHEARKDKERIRHLARKARERIDVLPRSNASAYAARKLQDRVDAAVSKVETFAEDFARIVEKSARAGPVSFAASPVNASASRRAANGADVQPVMLAAVPATERTDHVETNAAANAVHLLTRFRSQLKHQSSNTDAINEQVEKAAVNVETPYIHRRNQLMARLAELSSIKNESRRQGLIELDKLRHDFDEVDRQQRRALRASMGRVEEEARLQERENEERADRLARFAQRQIDHLSRGRRPAERQARALQDRIENAMDASQDLSEDLQRRVTDLAREHIDHLDYSEATSKDKFDRVASLQRVATTQQSLHLSFATASAFIIGTFCGLAATASAISMHSRRTLRVESQRPLLLRS